MAANFGATLTSVQHPALSAPRAAITYEPLRDGTAGTLQSLEAMARAVRGQIPPDYSGYLDPKNQTFAIWTAYTGPTPIDGVFSFVRDTIRYIQHPLDMQVVQDARRTIEAASGDCVSKSVLLATLLAAIQIKPRFIAQASNGFEFDHVYVEALNKQNNDWIALDPTADGREGRPFGDPGWRQALPLGGVEMPFNIF